MQTVIGSRRLFCRVAAFSPARAPYISASNTSFLPSCPYPQSRSRAQWKTAKPYPDVSASDLEPSLKTTNPAGRSLSHFWNAATAFSFGSRLSGLSVLMWSVNLWGMSLGRSISVVRAAVRSSRECLRAMRSATRGLSFSTISRCDCRRRLVIGCALSSVE
jgi:hypothetical protein